jgi:hypothetical protein
MSIERHCECVADAFKSTGVLPRNDEPCDPRLPQRLKRWRGFTCESAAMRKSTPRSVVRERGRHRCS